MNATEPETFIPSDKVRTIFAVLNRDLANDADNKFFEMWEAEIDQADASLRAGSVIAAAYMQNAARFAVFGAQCSGREPRLEQWLALARENFEKAIEDVANATRIAESQTGAS